ncbi:MAG: COQ9 family protein, partial [Proteobacteria bacterium]|nr:COQ9 family protein [Pseudomonadota bacterium]
WAGDTATDQNHYSKRAILGGILIPALTMRWFDGREAAEGFVARRIDNVMAFEKWKAGKDFDAPVRTITDVLGRLRYGAKA